MFSSVHEKLSTVNVNVDAPHGDGPAHPSPDDPKTVRPRSRSQTKHRVQASLDGQTGDARSSTVWACLQFLFFSFLLFKLLVRHVSRSASRRGGGHTEGESRGSVSTVRPTPTMEILPPESNGCPLPAMMIIGDDDR